MTLVLLGLFQVEHWNFTSWGTAVLCKPVRLVSLCVNSSGGPKVKWGAWIPLPVPVQDAHACCHLNSLSVSLSVKSRSLYPVQVLWKLNTILSLLKSYHLTGQHFCVSRLWRNVAGPKIKEGEEMLIEESLPKTDRGEVMEIMAGQRCRGWEVCATLACCPALWVNPGYQHRLDVKTRGLQERAEGLCTSTLRAKDLNTVSSALQWQPLRWTELGEGGAHGDSRPHPFPPSDAWT